jgi:hypothetical protein
MAEGNEAPGSSLGREIPFAVVEVVGRAAREVIPVQSGTPKGRPSMDPERRCPEMGSVPLLECGRSGTAMKPLSTIGGWD